MSSSTPEPLLDFDLDSFDFTLDDFLDEVEIDALNLPKTWDKRTGKPCVNQLEIGDHVVNYNWIENHWPCDKRTGKQLAWGTTGTHVVDYKWIQNHWPHDKTTGKRLVWGTTGTHVKNYQWIQSHWPHDKNTGKKLPLGTEGSHVKSYYWIKNNWPHDRRTGEKLEWGTEGSHIVTYSWRQNHWPYDKKTGEKLEWGAKGPDVITSREKLKLKSRLIYACDVFDNKGKLIYKKGSHIAPRSRVKKWGPGTIYEVGSERPKPVKRKRVTTKGTGGTLSRKTAGTENNGLSQERNRLFTHEQTDTPSTVSETTSTHIRCTVTV